MRRGIASEASSTGCTTNSSPTRAQFEAAVQNTNVADREPTRDIYVGHTFRFKKHTTEDMVSSHPTEAFLHFALQDPPQLIQEVRLIGGYRWDPETREIGTAVVPARDGKSNVLWVVELAETGALTDCRSGLRTIQ